MSERSEDIRQRREKAVAEFDQRAQALVDQIAQKGRPKLRTKPFKQANREDLDNLIAAIERRLATTVMPDEYGLYNVLSHLKSYNLENPSTDEA